MRQLHEIAREINLTWENLSPHARPYVSAMSTLRTVHDLYGLDGGDEIVARFLANAGSWRGDVARRVKAELNAALKSIPGYH